MGLDMKCMTIEIEGRAHDKIPQETPQIAFTELV